MSEETSTTRPAAATETPAAETTAPATTTTTTTTAPETTAPATTAPETTTPAPAAPAAPAPAGDILPPQHWAQIADEPEQEPEDNDSTVGDDNASSTASITSSILEYRTIHGRTFHSEHGNANYWGSNDELQMEMMDVTHHILTRGIGDKLFMSPLEKDKIQQVLDIGCGTGIWCIDFGDEFPSAEVIGTDISPIQPSWVPPNVRFEIEDFNQEWTFKSDFSDFIHARWLFGSVRDWDLLATESFRVAKPGGWFESLECSTVIDSDDGTVDDKSAMGHWGKFFIEGSKKTGASVTIVDDDTQRLAMEKAGFVNIQVFNFKNPVGDWPKDPVLKEMGAYTSHGLQTDSEGFVLFMAHVLGWSKEEIQVYLARFKREIRSGKHHGYFKQRLVWGQKPETA